MVKGHKCPTCGKWVRCPTCGEIMFKVSNETLSIVSDYSSGKAVEYCNKECYDNRRVK